MHVPIYQIHCGLLVVFIMKFQAKIPDTEQRRLKSNIWKIYLYRMLLGMVFPVPVIVLFWQNHGMNLTQIMVLQSIFATTMALLEMPSGYLADVIGRRKTLILAGCSNSIAVVVYSFSHHYSHFLVAEIFFACGFSLISGADAALIYDTLQAIGEDHRYQVVYGKLWFYILCAIGFSNILGGLIATINFRLTFYASVPFFLLAVVIAMTLREPPRKQLQVERGYLRELLDIFRYSFSRQLRWLIIFSGIVMGVNNAVLWFYQPYFKLCGLDIIYFGVVFASYQVVAAMSSKYAYKVESWLGSRHSLILLVVFVVAGYLLMGYFVFLFSFLFAFFQQFARGFSRIVISNYINQLTESDIRATVLSAQNLVMRLFYALLIPAAGRIADLTSVIQAMKILGLITIIGGTLMILILYREKIL